MVNGAGTRLQFRRANSALRRSLMQAYRPGAGTNARQTHDNKNAREGKQEQHTRHAQDKKASTQRTKMRGRHACMAGTGTGREGRGVSEIAEVQRAWVDEGHVGMCGRAHECHPCG